MKTTNHATSMSALQRLVRGAGVALLVSAPLGAGCAGGRSPLVLDLQGSVLYRKPVIQEVSYTVSDTRAEGGEVVVLVRLVGDVDLEATFEIVPGVADHQTMTEEAAGRYVGRFAFPRDLVGGPYTVVVRLRHEKAGEAAMRDPRPLFIPLVR